MSSEPDTRSDGDRPSSPSGGVYDWYRRGMRLLEGGDAAAAAQVLAHAHGEEPGSASILEGFARASFDAGRYEQAMDAFAVIVERSPGDDYARFGLGLSLARLGRHEEAVEPLALAAAMRPDRREYAEALRQSRATLNARQQPQTGNREGERPPGE